MSDNLMSRRKFLAGAGLVLGAASVSGVALLKDADEAAAEGQALAWPYPRLRLSISPIPRHLRAAPTRCTWLAARAARRPPGGRSSSTCRRTTPTRGARSAGESLFRFGGGGVAGWGTVCGTLNAAAGAINMVVANGAHRTTLTNAIFQYYAETPLPTNAPGSPIRSVLGPG